MKYAPCSSFAVAEVDVTFSGNSPLDVNLKS